MFIGGIIGGTFGASLYARPTLVWKKSLNYIANNTFGSKKSNNIF